MAVRDGCIGPASLCRSGNLLTEASLVISLMVKQQLHTLLKEAAHGLGTPLLQQCVHYCFATMLFTKLSDR